MTYESIEATNPYGSTDAVGVLSDCLTGSYTLDPLEKVVDNVVTFFAWFKVPSACTVIIDVLGKKESHYLTPGDDWTKITIENDAVSKQNVVIYPLTSGLLYIYEASLQVGNTPTEWIPAEEDIETWVTNQGYLTVTSTEITSKVSREDYTGEKIASLINQSADTVHIEAKHLNLNGAITANETFKIDEDGYMTAIGGTIANFDILDTTDASKTAIKEKNIETSVVLSNNCGTSPAYTLSSINPSTLTLETTKLSNPYAIPTAEEIITYSDGTTLTKSKNLSLHDYSLKYTINDSFIEENTIYNEDSVEVLNPSEAYYSITVTGNTAGDSYSFITDAIQKGDSLYAVSFTINDTSILPLHVKFTAASSDGMDFYFEKTATISHTGQIVAITDDEMLSLIKLQGFDNLSEVYIKISSYANTTVSPNLSIWKVTANTVQTRITPVSIQFDISNVSSAVMKLTQNFEVTYPKSNDKFLSYNARSIDTKIDATANSVYLGTKGFGLYYGDSSLVMSESGLKIKNADIYAKSGWFGTESNGLEIGEDGIFGYGDMYVTTGSSTSTTYTVDFLIAKIDLDFYLTDLSIMDSINSVSDIKSVSPLPATVYLCGGTINEANKYIGITNYYSKTKAIDVTPYLQCYMDYTNKYAYCVAEFKTDSLSGISSVKDLLVKFGLMSSSEASTYYDIAYDGDGFDYTKTDGTTGSYGYLKLTSTDASACSQTILNQLLKTQAIGSAGSALSLNTLVYTEVSTGTGYTITKTTGYTGLKITKENLSIGATGLLTVSGTLQTKKMLPTAFSGTSAYPFFFLPYVPYSLIDSTHTNTTYFNQLLCWICRNYPSVSQGTWIGPANPNSAGNIIVNIYNTDTVDGSTGLPQYSSIAYFPLNGTIQYYGTSSYTFYSK